MISKEDQEEDLENSEKVAIVNRAEIDLNSGKNSSEKGTETTKIKILFKQVKMKEVPKDSKAIVKIEKEEMIINKKIRTLWIENYATIGSLKMEVKLAVNVLNYIISEGIDYAKQKLNE
jgi:hypothetical protein